MSNTLRWMALASLLLLSIAGGTYYLAEQKEKARSIVAGSSLAGDQTTFAGLAPETNRWHVFALLSVTAGLALAFASVLVLRQEHREPVPSISVTD